MFNLSLKESLIEFKQFSILKLFRDFQLLKFNLPIPWIKVAHGVGLMFGFLLACAIFAPSIIVGHKSKILGLGHGMKRCALIQLWPFVSSLVFFILFGKLISFRFEIV